MGMREVLKKAEPDLVLVHGDTTTSTAAALASFYQQIPVGHVEAGLRTYNVYSPWPEEMNRQLTGRIARWHFAPTPLSRKNLINEGIQESSIIITKNTVIDALHLVLKQIDQNPGIRIQIKETLLNHGIKECLIDSTSSNSRVVLITGHRRENFGEGFINICYAIKELAKLNPEVSFIYPVHLNPQVRKPVHEILNQAGVSSPANLYLIEPLDYLPFIYLMNRSYLVLTDSGGIQEEAPGLGKPVLVMRNNTERPEAVEAGTVILVGTDKFKIITEANRLLNDPDYYRNMSNAVNPYGDGKACMRIVEAVEKIFQSEE
jgi:UDP-N-acetylglucosamine 2-epimerase (non-hydrolysing)